VFWPLASPFLIVLVAVLVALVALLQFGVLTFAFERLGLDRTAVSVVLLATFLGSAVNLPLFQLRSRQVLVQSRVVRFLGVRYVVPGVWVPQRTVVAVNVGGALVPVAVSFYLFVHNGLGLVALLAIAVVTAVVYLSARTVAGVGVVVPGLLPPVVAAAAALLLAGGAAPPVAYVAGVLGTLIGADLLNLHRIGRMGAPVVSIGGAGTFDGILLSGVIAVLIASLL
jgi:uncharacterized membrane protein